MRLKTVGALAYRELYLMRRKLIGTSVTLAAVSVISLLVLASFYYGNIGMVLKDEVSVTPAALAAMTEEERASMNTPEENMEFFKTVLAVAVKLYPVLMAGFMTVSIGENCIVDENNVWRCYYRTLPATPLEKASATYLLIIASDIVGAVLAFAFSGLVSAITGVPIFRGDIAVIIAALAVGNILCVLFQLGIKLFHSFDKAGIAIFGTLFVAVFGTELIMMLNRSDYPPQPEVAESDAFNLEQALNMYNHDVADKILPIAIPAMIIAPIVGFTAYYLICKRREK